MSEILQLPQFKPPVENQPKDQPEDQTIWVSTNRVFMNPHHKQVTEYRALHPFDALKRRYYGRAPSPAGWIEFILPDAKDEIEAFAQFDGMFAIAFQETLRANTQFQLAMQQRAQEAQLAQQLRQQAGRGMNG